jgi:type I restriction enzyme M protein
MPDVVGRHTSRFQAIKRPEAVPMRGSTRRSSGKQSGSPGGTASPSEREGIAVGGSPDRGGMTKEIQRAELHRTIWRIANDLRGSVDGWDFKTYVLGMLFYRFISENLTAYLNGLERQSGLADFDYAALSDADAEFGRKVTVEEKGFFILPSELFVNVRKRAKDDENLNETLERVFGHIEGSASGSDSEDDLKGLFADLDVNSAKLGNTVAKRNEKLVKLLDAIGDLPLGSFADNTIDLFGDAYEYLMQMYASTAGKSGGEYYTPQEVSELLARITVVGKTEVNKVYDPRLRLWFAAPEVRQGARQGWRAPRLLRSGDQPDHLQPVPDQHVLA